MHSAGKRRNPSDGCRDNRKPEGVFSVPTQPVLAGLMFTEGIKILGRRDFGLASGVVRLAKCLN
jgi:hypothetical protein